MGQIGKGRGGEGWNQTWRQDAGRQTRGNTRSNRHTHTPRPQVQPTEIRPTNIYSPQPSKSQGLPYYLLSLPLWLGLRPPCIQCRVGKASVQVQASGQGWGPRRRVGPFRSLQVLVRKHSPSLSWVGQASGDWVGHSRYWESQVLRASQILSSPHLAPPCSASSSSWYSRLVPVCFSSAAPLSPDSSQLAHQPLEGLPRTQAPMYLYIAVPAAANREQ